MRILLIEDEKALSSFIKQGLEAAGHVCVQMFNGAQGLLKALQEDYDVILLDLMLPQMSGMDILKQLREYQSKTPVVVISALDHPDQVVKALDEGAMDYLRKPFAMEELLARLRALQRRIDHDQATHLQVGDLTLDYQRYCAYRGNKTIALTRKEFALLELLMRNADRVLTKTFIAEKVWEVDFDMSSNIVEAYIYQLRKKIDKGFDYPMIETLVGIGYRLRSSTDP